MSPRTHRLINGPWAYHAAGSQLHARSPAAGLPPDTSTQAPHPRTAAPHPPGQARRWATTARCPSATASAWTSSEAGQGCRQLSSCRGVGAAVRSSACVAFCCTHAHPAAPRRYLVTNKHVGDSVALSILRGGKEETVQVGAAPRCTGLWPGTVAGGCRRCVRGACALTRPAPPLSRALVTPSACHRGPRPSQVQLSHYQHLVPPHLRESKPRCGRDAGAGGAWARGGALPLPAPRAGAARLDADCSPPQCLSTSPPHPHPHPPFAATSWWEAWSSPPAQVRPRPLSQGPDAGGPGHALERCRRPAAHPAAASDPRPPHLPRPPRARRPLPHPALRQPGRLAGAPHIEDLLRSAGAPGGGGGRGAGAASWGRRGAVVWRGTELAVCAGGRALSAVAVPRLLRPPSLPGGPAQQRAGLGRHHGLREHAGGRTLGGPRAGADARTLSHLNAIVGGRCCWGAGRGAMRLDP